ncbi:TetR/AcrR family transcriptional regulator [Pleomorphomonas oryzae]|uniref:TetR/AcrR family transcriptional regulator n=1 Tax=Pleomorphomonas oryzae TaxID=261934 RepID=UPI00040ECD8A|nr:TetR/AcrR family transcriptional regulator [Pleomorphomonas oryzae]
MRSKTDEKRNAIIAAATAVFEEVGYQRASMAMIAARLGGSKATLYGYFHSKEQLFATAVTSAFDETGEELLASLASTDDIATVLAHYGRLYLDLVTQPEILAIQRTVLSEGQGTTLGQEVYELGPQRGLNGLMEFLEKRAAAGEIDLPSPEIGALHFKGLVEAGITEPRLYGITETRDKREAVETAVAAFMRIYGRSQT